MTYTVQVRVGGEWANHSSHESYRDAVDQADMVRGRVLCGAGATNEEAYRHARDNQGFDGGLLDWESLDDAERAEYEAGAAGI